MNRRRRPGTAGPLQTTETREPSRPSVIKRRETGPLLHKARELAGVYGEAADCGTAVLDQDGELAGKSPGRDPFPLCGLCRRCYREEAGGEGGGPRFRPLGEGVAEARRRGGPYIYMCDPGLIYWICPVYAGGRYAGALAAGGVSAGEGRRLVENIRRLELEKTAGEKAEEYAAKIPVKDHEEIKALARLLRVCTERLENNTGEGGEGIRRPWDEELKANRAPRPAADTARQTNPAYPLDQERLLLAAMRRGDNETGRKILNELLEIALVSNPGNIKIIRLRAIELATLLSRAAAGDDAGDSSILEINDHCIRKIQESKNMEELAGSLYLVLDRVAGRLFSFKGIRHASALRRAERFIRENYTRKISLRETAEISGLSAPYFSTIFREEMGENFSTYINRLRVEKAALMMRETGMILNEIAEACGFEDQSWFSKIFKSHTGMSPGKYRDKCGGLRFSEGEEIERWGR